MPDKTLQQMMAEVADWGKRKGWEFAEHEVPEKLLLMHTEISEAVEEYRNHHGLTEVYESFASDRAGPKPEGVPIELADLFIRLIHFCALTGIDLEAAYETKMAYNEKRPFRHGGKKA